MSKERELLERLLKADVADYYDLLAETREFLIQPEQALTGDTIVGIWRDGYDAGERLAQPGQEPAPVVGDQNISLRDHFAGLAMQGLMSVYAQDYSRTVSEKDVAEWAYEQADAMLSERGK